MRVVRIEYASQSVARGATVRVPKSQVLQGATHAGGEAGFQFVAAVVFLCSRAIVARAVRGLVSRAERIVTNQIYERKKGADLGIQGSDIPGTSKTVILMVCGLDVFARCTY